MVIQKIGGESGKDVHCTYLCDVLESANEKRCEVYSPYAYTCTCIYVRTCTYTEYTLCMVYSVLHCTSLPVSNHGVVVLLDVDCALYHRQDEERILPLPSCLSQLHSTHSLQALGTCTLYITYSTCTYTYVGICNHI